VRDQVFSGQDVDDALAVAAATLGLPRAELRYVVLDAGSPAARGLKSTPARIAVMLEQEDRSGVERARGEPERTSPEDPRAGVRATLRAVAEAGGLELSGDIEETDEATLVRLHGPDETFLLGEDGKGEPLRATEHLLQRMYGAALYPKTLRLTCEGFRARRDQALAEEARRLAAEVRAEGRPRAMMPLNAYERRVVHIALQGEPGVTTYSVGDGPERRVTVAPAPEGGPGGPPPEAGDAGGS
jgi:spoIIIJ-associated protein